MIKVDKRILRGILAFLATLALLYFGQAAWQSRGVLSPLDKALHGIPGVSGVALKTGNGFTEPIQISVTLGEVDNLQKKYTELAKQTAYVLNGRKYMLETTDSRTPELEALYDNIQFYVQQSLVDGSFPLLAEKVTEKSLQAGVKSTVQVDRDRVYVKLVKGNHNLYAVIERKTEEKETL